MTFLFGWKQRPTLKRPLGGLSHLVSSPHCLQGKGVEELVGVSCNGACSKDTPKLSDDELDQKMLAVPLWKLNDARTEITRSFTARNWGAAMDFLNKLSVIVGLPFPHPRPTTLFCFSKIILPFLGVLLPR